ncbi:Nucleotide-binding, alpha-beta plait [Corchorus olitorius]|uniref:Nucleotide-binding, alpha-beta plait n=1 Tax=Corchorus olitorius TaxID=93759 RepID=A0A1R3IQH0_9ROSI|nr:Nucleotide-binding, alpha-beta plait [Corchorus olitorius]
MQSSTRLLQMSSFSASSEGSLGPPTTTPSKVPSAIEGMNGQNLDGRNITVNEAQSRISSTSDGGFGVGNGGSYNRGGGGGFGGSREGVYGG